MRLVLTAVGSAIGGPIGGFVGGLIGGAVDNAIFGPSDTRSDAPGLQSLTVSLSADGNPIQDGYGTHFRRGVLIWSGEKKENRTSETEGGKDFGGPTHTTTNINPTVSCAYTFGWGVGRPVFIKANKRVLVDYRPDATFATAPGVNVNIYDGSQTEPSYLAESIKGQAPAYVGQIIVEFEELPIAQFGNDPPQYLEAMIVMDATSLIPSTYHPVQPTGVHLLQYQYYDAARDVIWMGFDDSIFNDEIRVVAVDVKTRSILMNEQWTGTENTIGGIRKLIRIDALDMSAEELIAVNTEDFIAIYDADTFGKLTQFTHTISGGALMTLASDQGLFTMDGTSTSVTRVALYSHYSETETDQGDLSIPGFDVFIEASCELGEAFLVPIRRISDNGFCLSQFSLNVFGAGGGSFGPVNFQQTFDGGVGWSVLPYPAYASITNTFFMAATISYTAGVSAALLEISPGGDLMQVIDIQGQTGWSSGAGLPHLTYATYANAIQWKDATDLVRYRIATGEISRVNIGVDFAWNHYDQPTDSIFGGAGSYVDGASFVVTKLNSVDTEVVTVASVLTDICKKAGVDPTRVNTSAIPDTMNGAPLLIGSSARTNLEKILSFADAFGVMAGNQIRFAKRGGSVVRSIPVEQLGVRSLPQPRQSTMALKPIMHENVPAIMDLDYIGLNAEGETTSVRSHFHFGTYRRPVKRETIVVLSSGEAAAMVNRLHQRVVNAETYEGIRILPGHLDLESGDIVEVAADPPVRMMLTEIKLSPSMAIEVSGIAEYTDDSISAGVGADDNATSTVAGSVVPQLLLLDTPLLRDVDDGENAGPYVAVFKPFSSLGAVGVHGSASGDTFNLLAALDTEAAVGVTETVAAPVTTIDAWDDVSTIRATFVSGTAPASITDADILAGANPIAYGRVGRWEIIQPATWTLVTGTTYDITHMLRGRRGTDALTGTHQVGDYLVVLDQATVRRLVLSASVIGTLYNFKALSIGNTLSEVSTKSLVIGGNPLKPYSAYGLAVATVGTSRILSWTARTRKGGVLGGSNGLVDGIPGSQSDAPVTFEMEIWNLAQTTRFTTKTVIAENYDYTESERIADGLTADQNFVVKLLQLNGAIRGFPAELNTLGTSYSEIALNLGPTIGYVMDEISGTVAADVTGNYDATIINTVTLAEPSIINGEIGSFFFDNGALTLPNSIQAVLGDGVNTAISIVCAFEVLDLTDITNRVILTLFDDAQTTFSIIIANNALNISGRAHWSLPVVSLSTPLVAGRYHLAMVWDTAADTARLYFNGIEVENVDPAGFGQTGIAFDPTPSGTRKHTLFGDENGASALDGHAQGAYIYAKALSAEDIAALATFV